MEIEDPAKRPSATLELPDENVYLWRSVTFAGAPQQFRTGDRMIIEDKFGFQKDKDDVFIVGTESQRTVKRLMPQGEVLSPKSGYGFADLDAEDQKRLLAIYKKFDAKQ
jgi:hypothetical protein